jgi:hypothetical protein
MSLRKLILSAAIVAAALVLGAPAHAQATRTWVSGVGDDANPCSRTAPCKTFPGAISKTAAGGEIDCLDPGGFGTVTITKSITIDCHEIFGSILAGGTNGININSDNTNALVVRIRNLNINGITGSGTNGIRITGGTTSNTQVIIEDCMIDGFNTRGITDERTGGGHLWILNTTVRDSPIGVAVTNSAILASLNNVRVFNGSSTALTVNTGATAMVNNSVFAGSGIGLDIESGATANVNNSVVDHNTTGVFNNAATVRLSNSNVAFNGTGVNGTVLSFSNNRFTSNGAGGTISAITPAGTNPSGQQ